MRISRIAASTVAHRSACARSGPRRASPQASEAGSTRSTTACEDRRQSSGRRWAQVLEQTARRCRSAFQPGCPRLVGDRQQLSALGGARAWSGRRRRPRRSGRSSPVAGRSAAGRAIEITSSWRSNPALLGDHPPHLASSSSCPGCGGGRRCRRSRHRPAAGAVVVDRVEGGRPAGFAPSRRRADHRGAGPPAHSSKGPARRLLRVIYPPGGETPRGPIPLKCHGCAILPIVVGLAVPLTPPSATKTARRFSPAEVDRGWPLGGGPLRGSRSTARRTPRRLPRRSCSTSCSSRSTTCGGCRHPASARSSASSSRSRSPRRFGRRGWPEISSTSACRIFRESLLAQAAEDTTGTVSLSPSLSLASSPSRPLIAARQRSQSSFQEVVQSMRQFEEPEPAAFDYRGVGWSGDLHLFSTPVGSPPI